MPPKCKKRQHFWVMEIPEFIVKSAASEILKSEICCWEEFSFHFPIKNKKSALKPSIRNLKSEIWNLPAKSTSSKSKSEIWNLKSARHQWVQALKSEIDDREKEVKRRKLEENSAVQSDLSNDNWDNNEDCDYLIGQSSSFYQQPPASSSSGIKDTSLPTTAVNSMLQAANPVHFDETIQFLQSTAGDVLKATEFSYTYDAKCNNWTENDDEQQQYMFDFLTSLWVFQLSNGMPPVSKNDDKLATTLDNIFYI